MKIPRVCNILADYSAPNRQCYEPRDQDRCDKQKYNVMMLRGLPYEKYRGSIGDVVTQRK